MSKVFVNIGLSLDGYMAPEGMTMENPEYKGWGAKWGAMMSWILEQQYLREILKFGPGGETGPVNDMVRHTMERTGANIMGKRMMLAPVRDRKSTRLNSSHGYISYAVFCLKKKKKRRQ